MSSIIRLSADYSIIIASNYQTRETVQVSMSNAVEESACQQFQRLSDCEFPRGHMAAINGNEFVIVPHYTCNSVGVWKYSFFNDQWTSMMPLDNENVYSQAIDDVAFDPNTKRLYLSVHHVDKNGVLLRRYLQSVDTEQ